MFRQLILVLLVALLSLTSFRETTVDCLPVEREGRPGRQLDFPDGNDIPSDSVPNSPNFPPANWPGRGRGSGDGLLGGIMNFFRRMLGLNAADGGSGSGGSSGSSGILGFIRRAFGGLINTVMSLIGGGRRNSVPFNPDATEVEFPLRRPRNEPLRQRAA